MHEVWEVELNIYIAAAYESKERLRSMRDRILLIPKPLKITSEWLDEDVTDPLGIDDALKKKYAIRDLNQIMESHLLIIDTFDTNLRGGREVELGAALAGGGLCWIVGPRRNVFHQLAHHFDSWDDVIDEIAHADL